MSTRRSFNIGRPLKLIATIAGLLVLVSGLIAGVMDTKVRVNVLERDVGKVEGSLERHMEKASGALDRIQEGIHTIDKKQNRLDYQIQDIIEHLERENP